MERDPCSPYIVGDVEMAGTARWNEMRWWRLTWWIEEREIKRERERGFTLEKAQE